MVKNALREAGDGYISNRMKRARFWQRVAFPLRATQTEQPPAETPTRSRVRKPTPRAPTTRDILLDTPFRWTLIQGSPIGTLCSYGAWGVVPITCLWLCLKSYLNVGYANLATRAACWSKGQILPRFCLPLAMADRAAYDKGFWPGIRPP